MRNFAAIDFETANHHRTSVCSVGVVIVRDGQIVDKFYKLIRPYPNYYSKWATECHGISPIDTEDALRFPEVWSQIAPQIEGLPLIAHNKSFDEQCLIKCHEHFEIPYPDYEFHCTLKASKKEFGKLLPNHQLHTVSAHCGFELQNHHHALADAEACAIIAMQIL